MEEVLSLLTTETVDVWNILFSLSLAVAVGFIISQIYKYTHRGLNYELAFMTTLVILAPIISIVMLFIRGDLVLSLGLIGSISIIRFRTPIKDTRDMVFIFWVIAVGLGSGTFNWNVVIISTIFISIIMFLLHFIRYGKSKATDYVLVVSGIRPSKNAEVYDVLYEYIREIRVRSHETEEERWEIIYEVQFRKLSDNLIGRLHDSLLEVNGVEKVSLLAPQIALPV